MGSDAGLVPEEEPARAEPAPEVPPGLSGDPMALGTLGEPASHLQVDLSVHDSSQFEWKVALPLEGAHLGYSIEAEFEVPGGVSRRSPWEQIQELSKFDSPLQSHPAESGSVDGIRHAALALTQFLRRARAGFERHCRLVAQGPGAPGEAPLEAASEEDFLTTWLDAALAAVFRARLELTSVQPTDWEELIQERALADEFISVRMLEWLADAQEIVDQYTELGLLDLRPLQQLQTVAERLAQVLERELTYRQRKGLPQVDSGSEESLERYVERAGLLKRHFEDVLVLERTTYQQDYRVQQWLTSFAALFAGALAFVVQLVLPHWATSSGSRVSVGLLGVTLLAGLSYAARDRLKEVGRAWLTGKVYRFHAQRVVRCFAPGTNTEPVVVAREWSSETSSTRPDLLNPESGASRRVTLVHHLHQGTLRVDESLRRAGIRRLRHEFRYDLSPVFSSLHDPVKRIPALDPRTGRARFVNAPRRYRVPIRVEVRAGGERLELRAVLVIDKQGLRRLEKTSTAEPSQPSR